jgi:hypothetical protein
MSQCKTRNRAKLLAGISGTVEGYRYVPGV